MAVVGKRLLAALIGLLAFGASSQAQTENLAPPKDPVAATLEVTAPPAPPIQLLAIFGDKALLDIEGKQQTLKPGQKARGVALERLERDAAWLQIDGQSRRIKLGGQLAPSAVKPELILLRDPRNGIFHTKVLINGSTLPGIIDTGATSLVLNSQQAAQIGLKDFRKGPRVRVSTASDVRTAYQVQLRQVQFGPFQFEQVQALVMDGAQPSVVLIGNSLLNRLHLQQTQQQLIIRQ